MLLFFKSCCVLTFLFSVYSAVIIGINWNDSRLVIMWILLASEMSLFCSSLFKITFKEVETHHRCVNCLAFILASSGLVTFTIGCTLAIGYNNYGNHASQDDSIHYAFDVYSGVFYVMLCCMVVALLVAVFKFCRTYQQQEQNFA